MELEKIEDNAEDMPTPSRASYGRQTYTEERLVSHRTGEIALHSAANPANTSRNAQAQVTTRSARKRARLSINVPQDIAESLLDDETSPEVVSPIVVRNPPSSQKLGEDSYPATLTWHANLNSMTMGW